MLFYIIHEIKQLGINRLTIDILFTCHLLLHVAKQVTCSPMPQKRVAYYYAIRGIKHVLGTQTSIFIYFNFIICSTNHFLFTFINMFHQLHELKIVCVLLFLFENANIYQSHKICAFSCRHIARTPKWRTRRHQQPRTWLASRLTSAPSVLTAAWRTETVQASREPNWRQFLTGLWHKVDNVLECLCYSFLWLYGVSVKHGPCASNV